MTTTQGDVLAEPVGTAPVVSVVVWPVPRARDTGLQLVLRARTLTVALIMGHTYFGSGWAFGPPRLMSAPGYHYTRMLAGPHWWGWALLAGAVLTAVAPWCHWRLSAALHVAAAVPLAAMAVTLGMGDITAVSMGWGGTGLFLVPTAGHALLILARYQHARAHPDSR